LKLPIDKLKPGMRVTRDVINLNHAVILAAGAEMTAQHLHTLKMWGIDAVEVAGEQAEAGVEVTKGGLLPELLQAAEDHVNRRLRHVPADNPAVALVRDLAVKRAAARLASQPGERGQGVFGTSSPPNSRTSPLPCPLPPTLAPGNNVSHRRPISPNPRQKGNAKAFAEQAGDLPSLPALYYELVQAIQDPDSSIDQITGIIQQDQSLASRLLRLANSGFYGFPSDIGTLGEAVQLIGLREIQDLVLATSVIRAFDKVPRDLVDVASFWQHSIACGTASALLAEQRHDPAPERFFVGGLLHDIGRLILFLSAPEESRHILERCETECELASRIENEVLGFDHTMLGAELIELWKLPQSLREMVGNHHDPSGSPAVFLDAFVVHYADFITSALEYGKSGELFVSPFVVPSNRARWLMEGDRIEVLVRELDRKCEEIFPILSKAET
jgi:putative nucleotidyltransferase with HDIG domain